MVVERKYFFILLVCSTSLTCAPIRAQDMPASPDVVARLNAIEAELAAKRTEISNLEDQLKELRNLLAPPQNEAAPTTSPTTTGPPTTGGSLPSAQLTDAASLDEALADPNRYFEQLGASDAAREIAARALNNKASQPIFDRPNLPSGLSAALTLGNSSEASINYSYPIVLRKKLNSRSEFRPQVATFSASITTPLQSGIGTLLSDTAQDRYERANLDIPSGTRIRLGFDFLSYPPISNRQFLDSNGQPDPMRSFAARRRVVDVLYAAKDACTKHYGAPSNSSRDAFYSAYGALPPAARENTLPSLRSALSDPPTPEEQKARKQEVENFCSGDNLARFIVAQQNDSTTASGTALMNPTLARSFLGAFWDAAPLQLPTWGLGFSGEFGTTDFVYRQANRISVVPDTDAAAAGFPDRFNLSVDPAAGFDPPETDSHDFWSLRGYGLVSLFRSTPETATPAWFFPGITLVGSAEYASAFSFRPGTRDLTICPAQELDPITMDTVNVSVRCRTFNTDAPVKLDGTTLAAEARFRFLNVPLIRTLSFAPRYSYRLDDGAQVIDVPVYLQNDANGFGSAGIRFRHRWGGIDLLGNEDFKASEFVVFFVPLRFNGL